MVAVSRRERFDLFLPCELVEHGRLAPVIGTRLPKISVGCDNCSYRGGGPSQQFRAIAEPRLPHECR